MTTDHPIFHADSVKVVEGILADGPRRTYPSSYAAYDAMQSYRPDVDPVVKYLTVGVGADPLYLTARKTTLNVSVRKDHVDAFVRHLAKDPEVHTITVGKKTVYLRPDPEPSGILDDVLAELTA